MPIVLDKTSNNKQKEKSETRYGWGDNKAMDCFRRRILACIACASNRCNAIETLYENHVRNKLVEGPDLHTLYMLTSHTLPKNDPICHTVCESRIDRVPK